MTPELSERAKKIFGALDPFATRGVEIGPLNHPIVRKDHSDVVYVDYGTTEEVRGKPYDASINPADIVDIDVAWSATPLKECMPATHRECDWVIASHVIEHVPDIIGWLNDIRSILRPGGTLGLAIPDRRFTFDYCRNESTAGEMVEAFLLKYRRPSLRQVFDHCWNAVVLDANDAWVKQPNGRELPKLSGGVALQLAYDQCVEIVNHPRYIDSHCWVFTPASFLDNLGVLARLKLFPFLVDFIEPTQPGSLEFIVRLTAVDSAEDPSVSASIEQAMLIRGI